ncbi:MAG: DNA alkylation repair protein [Alistipes sp.]
MLVDPAQFQREEMDAWVEDFDSWDVCDQCCLNLFRRTPFAYAKVWEYAAQERLFTRRAGFALLATLSMGDKEATDGVFEPFFPLMERCATDERDAIKKAVNWALRQVGKRSRGLYPQALALAERLAAAEGGAARWIGKDAVRELHLPKIIARIP